MLKTTTLKKFLQKRLNELSEKHSEENKIKYDFDMFSESARVDGLHCPATVHGRLRRDVASNPAMVAYNEANLQYTLDLIVNTPRGSNLHIVNINEIIDELTEEINATYHDMDGGRVYIVCDGGISQGYVESNSGKGEHISLSVAIATTWVPYIDVSNKPLTKDQVKIKLIKRTPYHNRIIDMNEVDDVKLEFNSTIVGWAHDEVSASLKIMLPATFVGEYNYIEVTEFGGKVTRWFVLRREFNEPNVWAHNMRRDLIRENYDDLLESRFLIKRGFVQDWDNAIYNPEGGSFNKVLVNRNTITSPSYFALYLAVPTKSDQPGSTHRTVRTSIMSSSELINISSIPETLRIRKTVDIGVRLAVSIPGGYVYTFANSGGNSSGDDFGNINALQALAYSVSGSANPIDIMRGLADNQNALNEANLMVPEVLIGGDRDLRNEKTYIVRSSGKTYRLTISNGTEEISNTIPLFGSANEVAIANTILNNNGWSNPRWTGGQSPRCSLRIIDTVYDVTYVEVFTGYENIETEFPPIAMDYVNDSFGYNIVIGDFNNPYCAAILSQAASDYGVSALDLQIVPVGFTPSIIGQAIPIRIQDNNAVVGNLYILGTSNYTNLTSVEIDDSIQLKKDLIFNTTKIVCPNNSGEVEFNPRQLTRGRNYNIRTNITLKPNFPYYSITPISDGTGLYPHGDVVPLRLVLGGDFSLTMITNAMTDYIQNNKYFREIFAKQESSHDFNYKQEMDRLSVLQRNAQINTVISAATATTGLVGGLASKNPIGAAAAIGSGLSLGGTIASGVMQHQNFELSKSQATEAFAFNQRLRSDMFELNLATIRAMPNTIRKISSDTFDNTFSTHIEAYSCDNLTMVNYMENLEYLGFTIERTGHIGQYLDGSHRVTAQIMETNIISTHVVNELNHELTEGVLLIPAIIIAQQQL
jgi:hypothetical protein